MSDSGSSPVLAEVGSMFGSPLESKRDQSGRTKHGAMAEPPWKAARSIAARIVFPQEFISNGRVGIPPNHTVARDDIARLYGNARTKLIVWIRFGIIGFRSCMIGIISVPSRRGRGPCGDEQGGKRHERHLGNKRLHF